MRDVGIWTLAALALGVLVGMGIATERTADGRADETRAAVEHGMRACSDACAADLRRAAALAGRSAEGVEWRVDALRGEVEAAWGDCAVPGVWHRLGVVTLPEARGERRREQE